MNKYCQISNAYIDKEGKKSKNKRKYSEVRTNFPELLSVLLSPM